MKKFRRKKTISFAVLSAFVSAQAAAFQIDTGNSDVVVTFDNTVKLSSGYRLKNPDRGVAGDPTSLQINTNDGDNNFDRGFVSKRLDLLSEFEVKYKRDVGLRVSGAAWYDDAYRHSNDNPGVGVNTLSGHTNRFDPATKNLMGKKAEFLDAFVWGNISLGESNLNLKGGRLTQLYGESLFFGSNGIAAAQTPLDLARALSVPNSQFKEVARPVGQVAGQLQLNQNVSLGAYYQTEWRKSRLPAAGSFFSFADFVDDGGRTLMAPGVLPPGGYFGRGEDLDAKDSGQGGVQMKFKTSAAEFGVYAAQFHDKMPQFYVRPGVNANPGAGRFGDYVQVFGENIRTVGGSVSALVGDTNVAAELSFRDNMPLVANGNLVFVGTNADNDNHAAFPKGRTAHLNVSAIHLFGASPLWQGATFVGEFAFNRRLSVTENLAQLDPNATRDAGAVQFVFTPEYFQVLPGLDLQVPIGVSYGLFGRSSVNGALFPSEGGGNVSIGLKGEYQKTWQASINYTHYVGSDGPVINPVGSLSYKNFHGDRDFVSLSVQRSF